MSQSQWESLTNHIPLILDQVVPQRKSSSMESTSYFTDIELKGLVSIESGWRIDFTRIDLKASYPIGANGSIMTKYSMDKSYLLGKLIQENWNGGTIIGWINGLDQHGILGELQLSFILLIIGQVYDGLLAIQMIVRLLMHCDEAVGMIFIILYLKHRYLF